MKTFLGCCGCNITTDALKRKPKFDNSLYTNTYSLTIVRNMTDNASAKILYSVINEHRDQYLEAEAPKSGLWSLKLDGTHELDLIVTGKRSKLWGLKP